MEIVFGAKGVTKEPASSSALCSMPQSLSVYLCWGLDLSGWDGVHISVVGCLSWRKADEGLGGEHHAGGSPPLVPGCRGLAASYGLQRSNPKRLTEVCAAIRASRWSYLATPDSKHLSRSVRGFEL